MNGREAPWAKVPVHLAHDPEMTLGALRVYVTLDYLAGKRGGWFGDQSMVAEESGVSQATVSRALAMLCDRSYIAMRDTPHGSRYAQEFVILARFTPEDQVFTDATQGFTDERLLFTDESAPSLLTTQTSTQTSRVRKPKRRGITDEDITQLQAEHPDLDIPAFVADYLNWMGSANHSDKLLGFRNQLRDEWRCSKFRKGGPQRKGVSRGPASRDPEAFLDPETLKRSNVRVFTD